jgi:periplasmic glucans biosynthesis protein
MRRRRDFLKLAVAGALGGASAVVGESFRSAEAATPAVAPGPPTPFGADAVLNLSRDLAKKPFEAPSATLPDPFANLNYEQYVSIRTKPEAAIWASDNIGFAIEPLHRGFIFSKPMDIYLVENGLAQRLAYDRAAFDFGKLQVPVDLPDIGFSGFRVLQTMQGGQGEVAIFQGASFFRAEARGQSFGVSARGLSIRTAEPQGEEFPFFRAVWIERPTLAANVLIIHALLDSASLTGAYRFTLRPGDATIIDTELTLTSRIAVDHYGLSAMSATYLAGPLDHKRPDDFRPAIYEINGLQMLTGKGEWLWRPVSNRNTLQISAFLDENPKGFGLLQRSRSFDTFQDDDQHWEARPSLWVEPIGDWRNGEVRLVEIPSDSENNDNIIAYWRPNEGIGPVAEVAFAYRQFWCWTPPARSDLAIVVGSRTGKIGKRQRFLVDFSSETFAKPEVMATIKANLTAAPGKIPWMRTVPSAERKNFRVAFDLEPSSDGFSEFRLVLEADGKPVSETWLYRWTA